MKRYSAVIFFVLITIFIFLYNSDKHTLPLPEPVPIVLKTKAQMCMEDDDCLLLTAAGYYEARSEPDLGVIAVMTVIKNRVQHENNRFPKSIREVLTQRCEFSFLCDNSMNKPVDKKAWNRIATLAYDFHTQKYNLPSDLKFYHTVDIKRKPKYAKVHTPVMVVGKHVFYACGGKYC